MNREMKRDWVESMEAELEVRTDYRKSMEAVSEGRRD